MSGIIGLSSKERSGIVNESGVLSTTLTLTANNTTVNTWYLGDSTSGSTLAIPTASEVSTPLGLACTVSNEDITFPVTGWWKVETQITFLQQSHGYSRYVYMKPQLYDGSSWLTTGGAEAFAGNTYTGTFNSSYTAYNSGSATTIYKIAATNYKVRLMVSNPWTQIVLGVATCLESGAVFTRLGDI